MLKYLKKIINSESPESSKRFIAIWTMILVTISVGTALVMSNDYITVISILLTFVLSILGIASWQSVKNKNKEN